VFFGHTHVPSMFVARGDETRVALLRGPSGSLRLEPGTRYLINPGSVGQPRDGDPRASFAIYDDDERRVIFHRASYDTGTARRKILEAGLPPALGDRLLYGI
jgi:diadenosine tetraphosphatase ApaH/serine/threonine PP2A family protein phosphatase